MPFLSKMVSLWKNIFRRRQVEQDLNDELQAYVDEMVERKVQAGIAPETAREAVLLELGGMNRITDLVRQQRIGPGGIPQIGITAVVAIVAFISGAGAAVGGMRWSTPATIDLLPFTLDADEPREPLPVLQGRLVDQATGEPIPFVEVGLEPGVPIRRYTYTDDKGNFSFYNPPARYRLGAGKQHWSLDEHEIVQPPGLPPTPNAFFFLSWPSNVVVTNKEGQQLEGKRNELQGVQLKAPGTGRPLKLEYRRFRYSESIIELRATNLQPGRTAALRTGSPIGRKETWLDEWLSR